MIGLDELRVAELAPAISATDIWKAYPGVQALRGVDFTVSPGEVRALLGKNGAGKSTLVETLSGSVQPDRGSIQVAGSDVTLTSPSSAAIQGIATVHQELSVVPHLSVAENVFLGRWRETSAGSTLLRPRQIADAAATVLRRLDIDIDPRERVANLSIAHQQMVEIARGIAGQPRVLILDEPTSSLAAHEVDTLIDIVKRLAHDGVAVVYVSHRMDEIPRVADSLTVLRDGALVSTVPADAVTTSEVIQLMTGGKLHTHRAPGGGKEGAAIALHVDQLSSVSGIREASLDVRQGEVIGIAGLLGSGRTELLNCLAGLDRRWTGRVTLAGSAYSPTSVRGALARGVGIAPEDRKRDGLALDMSISTNLSMASPHRIRRWGLLSRRREATLARESVDRLQIKVSDVRAPVRSLSGGNQQKVVLGKCINAGSRILLLDEPTRGVDVEAKEQIYQLIRELALSGSSVVIASSEVEELFLVCDRILTLRQGRITSRSRTSETTVSKVLEQIMGGHDDD